MMRDLARCCAGSAEWQKRSGFGVPREIAIDILWSLKFFNLIEKGALAGQT
jgi:hypothetical protein